MEKISFKIAYPIILAGLFVAASFVALNYENLTTSFYVIFCLLVIYIFLFGFATGQNFSRPVKKLLQKADDLSKGNLKSRFYSESKDEISELGNIFNKMAEEIEESKTEAATLEKSVDIKVQARTQSLEDTINALEQKVKNRTLELQRIVQESEKMKNQGKLRNYETENLQNAIAQKEDEQRQADMEMMSNTVLVPDPATELKEEKASEESVDSESSAEPKKKTGKAKKAKKAPEEELEV